MAEWFCSKVRNDPDWALPMCLTPAVNAERERLLDGMRIFATTARRLSPDMLNAITPRWLATLYFAAKQRARLKKMEFTLSKCDLLERLLAQRGACALSGLPFEFTGRGKFRYRPFAPTIDRIDSSKGYVRSNVRIVCNIANFAMNEWGEAPLLVFARALVERSDARNVKPASDVDLESVKPTASSQAA